MLGGAFEKETYDYGSAELASAESL